MLRRSKSYSEVEMVAFDALVQGRCIGEGPPGDITRVPIGRCSVEAHEGFVSLAWSEGDSLRVATLTAERFEEYLQAGIVVIVDAAQLGRLAVKSGGSRESPPV